MCAKHFDSDIDIEYVDGITIVDDKGMVVYSVRYNPRFSEDSNDKEFMSITNKNLLEVYPTVNPNDSTILNCLKTGIPIYKNNQFFHDFKGRLLNTKNLTLPIIKMGKVLGAIELSKDITKIQDLAEEYGRLKTQSSYYLENPSKAMSSPAGYTFEDIITKNSIMLDNIEKSKLISGTSSTVLIYGETGTGKELFVQSIHNFSKRRDKPFIAQNCASLPDSLFESLLFGTVKGAFTGAGDRPGLFELADGGTLFLDEINSMSSDLQAKLLRVLQDGYIRRIGDTKDKKVDVRVITAMNVNPVEAVNKNQIRKDLFYRLNVTSIKLPPLRERGEDISLLVSYFINKYNAILDRYVTGIDKDVESFFLSYDWPGNVRELQHVIEASMNIVLSGNISIKHLPVYLNDAVNLEDFQINVSSVKPLNEVIDLTEKKMIIMALKKSNGNVSKAAKLLNVPRQTLQYKILKYEINI